MQMYRCYFNWPLFDDVNKPHWDYFDSHTRDKWVEIVNGGFVSRNENQIVVNVGDLGVFNLLKVVDNNFTFYYNLKSYNQYGNTYETIWDIDLWLTYLIIPLTTNNYVLTSKAGYYPTILRATTRTDVPFLPISIYLNKLANISNTQQFLNFFNSYTGGQIGAETVTIPIPANPINGMVTGTNLYYVINTTNYTNFTQNNVDGNSSNFCYGLLPFNVWNSSSYNYGVTLSEALYDGSGNTGFGNELLEVIALPFILTDLGSTSGNHNLPIQSAYWTMGSVVTNLGSNIPADTILYYPQYGTQALNVTTWNWANNWNGLGEVSWEQGGYSNIYQYLLSENNFYAFTGSVVPSIIGLMSAYPFLAPYIQLYFSYNGESITFDETFWLNMYQLDLLRSFTLNSLTYKFIWQYPEMLLSIDFNNFVPSFIPSPTSKVLNIRSSLPFSTSMDAKYIQSYKQVINSSRTAMNNNIVVSTLNTTMNTTKQLSDLGNPFDYFNWARQAQVLPDVAMDWSKWALDVQNRHIAYSNAYGVNRQISEQTVANRLNSANSPFTYNNIFVASYALPAEASFIQIMDDYYWKGLCLNMPLNLFDLTLNQIEPEQINNFVYVQTSNFDYTYMLSTAFTNAEPFLATITQSQAESINRLVNNGVRIWLKQPYTFSFSKVVTQEWNQEQIEPFVNIKGWL